MSLPNITIDLQNGRLGRVAQTSDGISGMVLTGATEGSMALNTAYRLGSSRDLTAMGVTEAGNPLVHKDVTQFYAMAGDGAELWLLVVAAATTLEQMCGSDEGSPLFRLISEARGRIRIIGINRVPPAEYVLSTTEYGIDADAVEAGEAAQTLAAHFAGRINPFRVLIPALSWDDASNKLFAPRESTWNRVGYVMAADRMIGAHASAAIGQVLGVAASIAVNQSIARVKNGMVALDGWLTNGKTPEENEYLLDNLHDAGYMHYRSFAGRNGYYFSDDPMAAPVTDDYSQLANGRTIDKAILLTYNTFVGELNENIEVDPETGKIPVPMCRYYEGLFDNAIATGMQDEISGFSSFVDPEQNVLRDEELVVVGEITQKGTLRKFRIPLGFRNPALNQ